VTVALALSSPLARTLHAQFPSEPPPPTALKPLEFPPFQEATLSNGLTVLVVESHRLPIVSVQLSLLAGSRYDPQGVDGLAGMVGELLTKGTERRTAEQIAEEIERVGASINAGAGSDFFSVATTVLTDNTELAFDMVSDIVLHSTFPAGELDIAKRRLLSSLRLEKSDPGALASRYFFHAVYGDHPYGSSETEESVNGMTREAVQQWASTYLKPGGGLLVLAGDITLDRARQMAQQYFGSWQGTPPSATAPAPPAPQPTHILLVHRPGSEQSNIRVGNLALQTGDNRYFAAAVGNKILGGGTDARLFMILREQKSWTYGAYSGLSRRKDIGYFQANTEVRTSVTDSALTELMHQLRRMRTEAVPDSELNGAKGYLVGSFPLSIETPQQIAGQVATVKLLGLGEDYLRTYRQRLDAVTARQIMDATKAFIKPDSAVVVVVGDGQAIYDKLAAIAPVHIIDVDGNPLAPDELTPTATALEFDPADVQAHRDSFNILVQGNPFGYRVLDLARDGASWVVKEDVSIPAAGLEQHGTLRIDAATLAAQSYEQTGTMQGQPRAVHLTYDGLHVTGTAQAPGGDEAAIDTTLAEGTVDAQMLDVLLGILPLEVGAQQTIMTFDAEQRAVSPTTVKVTGVEDVTVPAGTFTAYKVDVTQGQQAVTYWITQDAPHRVVRGEFVGQPVVFELIK